MYHLLELAVDSDSEQNVDVRSYVSEVRAQTEAEEAALNYQPSVAEQQAELGISMRLQAEDDVEEAAIAECTSPQQANDLLSTIMASAVASAEDAEADDARFNVSTLVRDPCCTRSRRLRCLTAYWLVLAVSMRAHLSWDAPLVRESADAAPFRRREHFSDKLRVLVDLHVRGIRLRHGDH